MPALNPSDRTMPVIAGNYLPCLAGSQPVSRPLIPCILLALPNPSPPLMAAAPATEKLTGDQPPQNAPGKDRSGIWMRNAATGLCLRAAAAAVVSSTAQYRLVYATRHLPVAAGLEAAIPDAAALVFACLGIAPALHGRRAIRARILNLASTGTSVLMNTIAAAPGWRNLAVWAMPPVAYALARHADFGGAGLGDRPPSAPGRHPGRRPGDPAGHRRRPAAVAAAPGPGARLHPGRVPRLGLDQCPVAPGRRHAPAPQSAPPPHPAGVRRPGKAARFLILAAERHGPLASIPLDRVAQIAAALASQVDLNPGSARAALRKAVLAARNGDPR